VTEGPYLLFADWLPLWKSDLADMKTAVAASSVEIGKGVTTLDASLKMCDRIAAAQSQLLVQMLLLADPKAANEFLRYVLAVDELIDGGGASHWQFPRPDEHCPEKYLLFAAIAKQGLLAMRSSQAKNN
jgi:hypothetical protein